MRQVLISRYMYDFRYIDNAEACLLFTCTAHDHDSERNTCHVHAHHNQ